VIAVKDRLSGESTERTYDLLGMITSEKLANGLQLEFTYDRMNRIRTLKLPDQSGVEYGMTPSI